MFETITTAAEKLATNVGMSRRGFLGRVGQTALVTAGAVAGVLASPGLTRAGTKNGHCVVALIRGRNGGGAYRYTGLCISKDCASGLSTTCKGWVPHGHVATLGRICSHDYDPAMTCSF